MAAVDSIHKPLSEWYSLFNDRAPLISKSGYERGRKEGEMLTLFEHRCRLWESELKSPLKPSVSCTSVICVQVSSWCAGCAWFHIKVGFPDHSYISEIPFCVCVCVHVHESVHAWPPREGGLLYGSLENDLVLWLSQEGECSVVTLRGRLLCATSRGRLRYAISRGRLLYGHIERERLLFDYLNREILFYSHLKMENVLSHNGICGAFCSLILLYKQDNHWIFFFFFWFYIFPHLFLCKYNRRFCHFMSAYHE